MSQLIEAASVLLCRSHDSSEVCLVHRAATLRFLGGFVAFPGGKTHAEDHALARPAEGLDHLAVAAVRELFEETGVLLARQPDGSFPSSSQQLEAARQILLEGGSFAQLCQQHRWQLHAADLRPVGRLITPPFSAIRFDTLFFAAHLPPGQTVSVSAGELSAWQWSTPSSAVADWLAGTLPLSPPTYAILDALQGQPFAHARECLAPLLARLEDGSLPDIWFSPGVRVLPLESAGLPPTTHTNAYLVGTDVRYLLDPGPSCPREQTRLLTALRYTTVKAVILTHHHPDHIGAAKLCAEQLGVPVSAHRLTAERLAGRVRVDRYLEEGEWLPLGQAPHGRGEWAMQALFTPGHAPGHLAFFEPVYGLLFAGDLVSPLSSLIISPQDGDLAQYLQSLHRVRALPTRLLLPAHGAPTLRPGHLLDETIQHRATRERHLLDALSSGAEDLATLTAQLYRGFPASVQKLGSVQIEANLIKLQREGRVRREGDRWLLLEAGSAAP